MPSATVGHGDGLASRIGVRVTAELTRHLAAPLVPGLHLVATPIGNLGDMTLRAIATLARADIVYAEDTRHSRTLIAHYGIDRRLVPYHEHNGERERPAILAALAEGQSVALISDAGTPLVSDPGYKLVRAVIEAGYRVEALPGPSATIAALAVAGLPTDTFAFAGFLPARQGQRRARIAELASIPATLVLFESPSRLADTLADLAAGLGDRAAVIARELTKLHEEVRRGTLSALAAQAAATPPRGEIVVLVAPPVETAIDDGTLGDLLEARLVRESLRDAAKAIAAETGASRARIYELGLALKKVREP